ncbi:MAG: sialate O-acetylesterase [bacterium]
MIKVFRSALGVFAFALLHALAAQAEVALPGVFGDHMVLQRDKPVPVFGTAAPGEKVAVKFHGQSLTTTADARGAWQVTLAAMKADTASQPMTVTGSNTVTLDDVLVGDVWLCSGQSNMDMRLGGCDRPADIASADFPGIRHFSVPAAASGVPLTVVKSQWAVCSPASASGFSATAFYFARKIHQDQKAALPVGLIVASVGGTKIDVWLAPDGLIDMPVLHPLYSQNTVPGGPFSLFNGMIHPLAPYGIKGALWYQGENSEISVQSPDSYYLKMKALAQGWKRLWGMEELPFYFVMLANYGEPLQTEAPVLHSGGWDADTRLQQASAMALPHAGCASAIDIGVSKVSWAGYHPQNKLEVGERLALWALKNDYGHPDLVASGPVLREVSVSGSTAVCSFDFVGSGLMAAEKVWYQPAKETPGGALRRFVIAGADGKWFSATAVIKDNKVLLSSPGVAAPRKVSYACWQNPEGCNLYNREGLPAAPFHVEDVTVRHTITASAGSGGEIAPAGAAAYLQRAAVLYTLTPRAGYHIQDVKVDGVSVGSVKSYTFDPLGKSHTIEAVFSKAAPGYTIAAAAGKGGTLAPSGKVTVAQGGSATFTVAADAGNRASLSVDGVSLGQRDRFTFSDVRANHTVAVSFACLVAASAGYGGTVTPSGTLAVNVGDSLSFKIATLPGYSVARVLVDGKEAGKQDTYAFSQMSKGHALAVTFSRSGGTAGRIPRPEELVFACRGEALPDSGACRAWPAQVPAGKSFGTIGAPAVETIDGRKYAASTYEKAAGFDVGTYAEPIACQGASIVAVARPVRNGVNSGWASLVDVFYDRLVLGIRGDSGLVCVRRNGGVDNSTAAIPDGQITILSLVVQPDGTYKVYANGTELMANNSASALTALVPGGAGPYARQITLLRNAPDAWTAFGGQIGDVFLYKVALTDAERQQLEALIAHELSGAKR